MFIFFAIILTYHCEANQHEFYFDRTTVNNMADLGSDVTLQEQVSLRGMSKMSCVFGCAAHDGCGWALNENHNCIFAGHYDLPGDVIVVTTWPVKAYQKRNNTQATPTCKYHFKSQWNSFNKSKTCYFSLHNIFNSHCRNSALSQPSQRHVLQHRVGPELDRRWTVLRRRLRRPSCEHREPGSTGTPDHSAAYRLNKQIYSSWTWEPSMWVMEEKYRDVL